MRASDKTFEDFRKIQQGFFVLPDAWDVMSAVVLERCGFPAIGTTSVGVGFVFGCPSDRAISREQMLAVTRDLCRAVKIPVCIDLESGYADTPEGVGEVVAEVIEAGAVSFNLEDSDGLPGKGLRPAEEHAERIRAARRAADRAKAAAFIVGRTDSFWINDDTPAEVKAEESIRRARLYRKAGADATFISGFKAIPSPIIRRLVAEIDGPFNTLISAGGPAIAEIEALGVCRLETGSLGTRAQIGLLKRGFEQVRDKGDLSLLETQAIPTKEINQLVRAFWQGR